VVGEIFAQYPFISNINVKRLTFLTKFLVSWGQKTPHLSAFVVPLAGHEASTRKRSVIVGMDTSRNPIRETREEGAQDVRRPPRSRRAGCFVGVCSPIAGGDKT
jgi:hypothetical protein